MGAVVYEGDHNVCSWVGHQIDLEELNELAGEIRERALDLAFCTATAGHLRDLAQTGLAADWIADFLEDAESDAVLDWQVGEAFAEATLELQFEVSFPWNTRRDERVPKASLPGADLVGLSLTPAGAVLVFGEVKSSSDASSPPGVLVGKSGMVQQLERILDDRQTQLKLIQWLVARVEDGPQGDQLDEALGRFVNSEGAAVRLIGALIRDTAPDEADISRRGQQLGDRAVAPGTVELHVWYLPLEMPEWPGLVAA